MPETLSYSASLVTQGAHRFFSLTMPSDVLARTCFVITRDEDPQEGFQRLLDKKRAQQIADYIDSGLGTVPSSIVLSAQPEAQLRYLRRTRTLEFIGIPKTFLILDGQHRVFGFSLAKTDLRVPVVIYNGLSRRDESRLFIDINSKQKGVPKELLLDIVKLAEYQDDIQSKLSDLFDVFNEKSDSPLAGLLSPAQRKGGKISRVTFNAAFKPMLDLFGDFSVSQIYNIAGNYLRAVSYGISNSDLPINLSNSITFRAFMLLFADVARTVQYRHGKEYTTDHFAQALGPMFKNLRASAVRDPGNSVSNFEKTLADALKAKFRL